MSKKLLALFFIIQPVLVFSQVSFNNLGVGYNISGRTAVNAAIASEIGKDQGITTSTIRRGGHLRQASVYGFNFGFKNAEVFSLNLDVLQGSESIYGFHSISENEVSYSRTTSIDLNINAATVGGRLVLRANTNKLKRVYYHVGLGGEVLHSYNVNSRIQENKFTYYRSTYQSESTYTEFESDVIQNYTSVNFIQQVGAGVRLANDERFYPLNKTNIELDVIFTNNFTRVNSSSDAYRTYGTGLRIVYFL
jgi:hypothetical protein